MTAAKLINEYRPSIPSDVLHLWAVDAVAALRLLSDEVEKLKGERDDALDDAKFAERIGAKREADARAEATTAEAEAAALRQKLVVARDALRPFAMLASHYPKTRRYGNRPNTGSILQVSSHGLPDAEITVEHLHAALAFIRVLAALESPDA